MSAILAVIGAGNFGSRHLQALSLLDRETRVAVVEPNADSARRAQALWAECAPSKHDIQVKFLTEPGRLPSEIDVAVVATNSDVRQAVLEKLLDRRKVRYLILEKVLFQRPQSLVEVGKLLDRAGTKAWVNCGRRMWPFYQEMRRILDRPERFEISMSGTQWGLATSTIHFLDLAAFLTGTEDFKITTQDLAPETIPSKRPGFIELTGTLTATSPRGGRVSLTSHREGALPPLLTVTTPSFRAVIRETEGKAWLSDPRTEWKWREETFDHPFQSRLTHLAVQSLLDSGDCSLTPYTASAALHRIYLETLLEHLRSTGSRTLEACAIT